MPILHLTSSDYEESAEFQVILRAVEIFNISVTIEPRVENAVRISVRAATESGVRWRVFIV